MGIKGGIARKILKIMVGVPKDAPYMTSEVSNFTLSSLMKNKFDINLDWRRL